METKILVPKLKKLGYRNSQRIGNIQQHIKRQTNIAIGCFNVTHMRSADANLLG